MTCWGCRHGHPPQSKQAVGFQVAGPKHYQLGPVAGQLHACAVSPALKLDHPSRPEPGDISRKAPAGFVPYLSLITCCHLMQAWHCWLPAQSRIPMPSPCFWDEQLHSSRCSLITLHAQCVCTLPVSCREATPMNTFDAGKEVASSQDAHGL